MTTTSLPHNLAGRILDGSPDAILVCDRAGTVRYWNTAAERVFGFRAAETVGASMDLIIPERLRVRHWAGWESAMKSGATRYGEGQLLAVPALHKDGRQISIEFSIQLLKGADGAMEWVVAFIRDVTERYNRERALRNELAALSTKSQDRHEADPRAARLCGRIAERRVPASEERDCDRTVIRELTTSKNIEVYGRTSRDLFARLSR